MQLKELLESDKTEYNKFVATHESGSFLQSWEWGELQSAGGRKVTRYKLQDTNGNAIGVVQFIQMSLPMGKHYWYAPYGPVFTGEWKLQDTNFKIQTLFDQMRIKFSDAVFVRIEPQDKSLILNPSSLTKTTNIQPGITMVVDLRKTDEELLTAMHPKTRYNIKVAEKHGVVVQSELVVHPQHGLYIKEAIDLIVETQKRQNYRGHGVDYYRKLIDFFALKNSQSDLKLTIYKALYNKQLLTSAIMVDFGKTRMYLYGGSSEQNKNVMAPYLLHWQAMQDAKKMGIENYDLGGSEVSSGGERGFTRFKQGFGGRVVEYAGAYDVVVNRTWYNVYKVFRVLNRLLK